MEEDFPRIISMGKKCEHCHGTGRVESEFNRATNGLWYDSDGKAWFICPSCKRLWRGKWFSSNVTIERINERHNLEGVSQCIECKGGR